MSDYPPRIEKSENIYRLWETGEGDMGELAIGIYDLTAHYKALWDDYAKLQAQLAKTRANFKAFREARLGHTYIDAHDRFEAALELIAYDHQTQSSFAAREDWHGLFNWAQDIAKKAIGGE